MGICPECLFSAGLGTITNDAGQEKLRAFQPPTPQELAPLFPQLEILELLGRGGMGAVYKARQVRLDRMVALKILPPGIGEDAAFAGRFEREAKALAKLQHPHIVTLYEFGQTQSLPDGGAQPLYYFLMEYVDGVTLRHLLQARHMSAPEALAIVPQICEALQFAHDRGIVHRDIKPENILLNKAGQVKIADFGVAKIVATEMEKVPPVATAFEAGAAEVTEAGKTIGTPNYMAPEQIAHPGAVDHRADIYALGVVFYQMLTGELPGQRIEPPSKKVHIDVRLDEIVLRALEKEPELRYQQASILQTQVETIAEGDAQLSSHGNGAAPSINNPASRWVYGLNYRSRATLFGLPLVHVAAGIDPATGRPRVAKGIIAIGGIAQGVVAVGGTALGGITMGGVSCGVLSYGGLSAGLLAFGGAALGLASGLGGMSVAPIAMGGVAVGIYAYGGQGVGRHVLDSATHDPAAAHFFLPWADRLLNSMLWGNLGCLLLMMGVIILVPWWLIRRGHAGAASDSDQEREQLLNSIYAWLGLMDRGDYAGSWTAAAESFQRVMKREEWEAKGGQVRHPLGGVISRQFRKGRFKFGGLRYEARLATAFEGLPRAMETVTFGRQANGEWKALGYLIRPASYKFKQRMKKLFFWLAWMVVIVLMLREYVIAPYYIPTDAVAPELPRGSRLLVWKLGRHFASGDLIAYRHAGTVYVARVARDEGDELVINRNGEADAKVGSGDVIGKVVSIYVRGSENTSDPSSKKVVSASPTPEDQNVALAATTAWLGLMDGGKYAESWEQAAESFRNVETRGDWIATSQQVRSPLGKVLSRKQTSAKISKTVEGMPDGNYFVVHFDTAFEKQAATEETVSFAQEKDGQWRAIGYFIKPKEGPEAHENPQWESDAAKAALAWLGKADAGAYAETYRDASGDFRKALTEAQWVAALNQVRKPLGELKHRAPKSSQSMTTVPDMPKGQYVMLQYTVSYASKESAVETVFLQRESDGSWKVGGYFIR